MVGRVTTSHRSEPVVAPSGWLAVLTRRGEAAGAVGPFATDGEAEAWAAAAGLAPEAGWSFTVEPLFDHADLPAPPPPRRRHLTLVRQ